MKGGYVEGEIAVLSSLGRGLHGVCLLPTKLSGICDLTVIFLATPSQCGSRACPTPTGLAQWLAWLGLRVDCRLQLDVLRCFQQITAILHQQI